MTTDPREIAEANDRIEREHIAECRHCRPGRMWACALVDAPEPERVGHFFSPHADAYDN